MLPLSFSLAEASTGVDGEQPRDEAYACLLYAAGMETDTSMEDLNQDGALTAADAAAALRFYQGLTARMPGASSGETQDLDGQILDAAHRLMNSRVRPDIAAELETLAAEKTSVYSVLASYYSSFSNMAVQLNLSIRNAVDSCAIMAEREYGVHSVRIRYPQRRFGWKTTAALYRAFGDSLIASVQDTMNISITLEEETVHISAETALFREILSQGTREQLMNGIFTLAYLNTVYDSYGEQTPYTPYDFPEGYLRNLIHPLPDGQNYIKDGWEDPRSGGTRLHMGTDIRAPKKTEIHSVTDGIVLYVGYMDIPGNYVVIQDPYGFEYHYYHMFEQSRNVRQGDVVRRGDVIGLVGNTGNSVANHLHLAVITPEGAYVNPYEMFLAAGVEPIIK